MEHYQILFIRKDAWGVTRALFKGHARGTGNLLLTDDKYKAWTCKTLKTAYKRLFELEKMYPTFNMIVTSR